MLNGFTALKGGYCLINDPSGENSGVSVMWIKDSPFTDYYIPGMLLVIFNGYLSLIIAFLVLFKVRKYSYLIMLQGFILIIWITTELFMVKIWDPLPPWVFIPLPYFVALYYLIAILLVVIGYLLTKKERQIQNTNAD